jgi:hypothetical protein
MRKASKAMRGSCELRLQGLWAAVMTDVLAAKGSCRVNAVALFNGSMSYTRFGVEGDLEPGFVERFEQTLALRRFMPLHESGDDLKSYGFVSALHPFDDNRVLNNDEFLFGDAVVLAFREDTIVFPKAKLKALVDERYRAEIVEGVPEKAAVRQKKLIEIAVKREMRARLIPRSRITDIYWETASGQVRVFGRGKGLLARIEEYFSAAFKVRLEPLQLASNTFNNDEKFRAAQDGLSKRFEPFSLLHN